MKLIQIILILGILSSCSQIQDSERAFPNLDEIKASDFENVHLYLDKDISDVFNKKLKDLDKSHPFYQAEDCESEMNLLAITPLDNSGKKYAILYGYCPDAEFHFYKADDLDVYYGSVMGERLFITGNGNLYVSGSIGSNFNAKRKYTFKENDIKEVEQPFYDVNLKTNTLKAVNLYKDEQMTEHLASLPANYPIEVVLAKKTYGEEELYLIKTDFGLLGWAKLKSGQYQSIDVEGIYWRGN